MLEVCVVGVLYPRVIDNEGKGYVAGVVKVETVGVEILIVIVLGEEFVDLGVEYNASLGC